MVDVPVPNDRTIDGADFMPTFEGKPIKRKIPLYWRNHIASSKIRVALRMDGWKILANEQLNAFQLYHIEEDWKEETDLARKHPKKLAEMKKTLLSVHKQVEKEGPRDWWQNAQQAKK